MAKLTSLILMVLVGLCIFLSVLFDQILLALVLSHAFMWTGIIYYDLSKEK